MGKTLPPPQTWDGEPTVRLPGPNTDPLPTGAPGLGLLVLTQGARPASSSPAWPVSTAGRPWGREVTQYTLSPPERGRQGAAVFPSRLLNCPPFPKH